MPMCEAWVWTVDLLHSCESETSNLVLLTEHRSGKSRIRVSYSDLEWHRHWYWMYKTLLKKKVSDLYHSRKLGEQ